MNDMCIIISRGERVLQKHRRRSSGFTLPEVLVSLAVCMLLMQAVGQWGILSAHSSSRIAQNQQALLIAQTVLAGGSPELSEGWSVHVDQKPLNDILQEWEITVRYENQAWQFYYAGE